MMKPSVQVHTAADHLLAEFWDCLRLDPAPTLELREHYDRHVKSGGAPCVVIAVGGVGFAGSSALGNFVALQRSARQNGGRVVFCHVDPTVIEVFRASKLDRLFEFVADREAAAAAVRRGEASAPDEPESAPRRPAGSTSTGLNRLRRKRSGPEPD
jgi:anti-anti-sigma factor